MMEQVSNHYRCSFNMNEKLINALLDQYKHFRLKEIKSEILHIVFVVLLSCCL